MTITVLLLVRISNEISNLHLLLNNKKTDEKILQMIVINYVRQQSFHFIIRIHCLSWSFSSGIPSAIDLISKKQNICPCMVCMFWVLNVEWWTKMKYQKKKIYSIQIRSAWIVSSVFHLNDLNTSLGLKYTSIDTNRFDKSVKTNGANEIAIKSSYEQIGSENKNPYEKWS